MAATSLRVLRAGMQTTVQAGPRLHDRHFGVATGGAADYESLQLANLLVGNAVDAAALEMTLSGDELLWPSGAEVAVVGADMAPLVRLPDGRKVGLPACRPVSLPPNSVTAFSTARRGCRTILAVAGGLRIAEVLGSTSTLLRSSLGGFHGRALQDGDELFAAGSPSRESRLKFHAADWGAGHDLLPLMSGQVLRIISGESLALLSAADRNLFLTAEFRIRSESDRMGARLSGPKLHVPNAGLRRSEPTTPGTIQLPPDGNPVLLLADSAPTGGYPQVAHVISADLGLAAQLPPGGTCRFEAVSVEAARTILLARHQRMQRRQIMIQELRAAAAHSAQKDRAD